MYLPPGDGYIVEARCIFHPEMDTSSGCDVSSSRGWIHCRGAMYLPPGDGYIVEARCIFLPGMDTLSRRDVSSSRGLDTLSRSDVSSTRRWIHCRGAMYLPPGRWIHCKSSVYLLPGIRYIACGRRHQRTLDSPVAPWAEARPVAAEGSAQRGGVRRFAPRVLLGEVGVRRFAPRVSSGEVGRRQAVGMALAFGQIGRQKREPMRTIGAKSRPGALKMGRRFGRVGFSAYICARVTAESWPPQRPTRPPQPRPTHSV